MNRKEIGGYFGLEQLNNESGEFYSNLIALNTSRNALVYILKARKTRKIYIPYMLCDSISLVCDREDFQYEYYNIDKNFKPIFDKRLDQDEYLYVVNFYGQISNDEVKAYKEKFDNIILDNSHAFFQEPIKGIDTIYSCRKFFGVPDGAYLSTDCILNEKIEQDVSIGRTQHLYGRIKDGASAHYQDFINNEESFANLKLMTMSNLTHELLGNINYSLIKKIREENYQYLHNALAKSNKINLIKTEGSFAYPLYINDGMKIKKILAEKKIYVPTLWPNVLQLEGMLEKDYAENILPLPCDQRYDLCDMQYVIETLEEFL